MPIVKRPEGYGQYIGEGTEKVVLGANRKIKEGSKRLVVKESKSDYFEDGPEFEYQKTPNFVKAQYYLTKIVHLLFPKMVPDIYAEGVNKDGKATVNQRVDIDTNRKKRISSDNHNFTEDFIIKSIGVKMSLGSIIYDFDRSEVNFVYDTEGNVVFVDSLDPWDHVGENDFIDKNYNAAALAAAIADMPNKRDREIAEDDFKRLEKLFEDENEQLKHK